MIEFIIGLFYVIIIANGVLYCITSFNQEYGYMQEVFNEEAEALAAEKAQNIAPQPMTNIDVMNDAVGCLVNLGHKKRESREAVAQVAIAKEYTDPAILIQDVLAAKK